MTHNLNNKAGRFFRSRALTAMVAVLALPLLLGAWKNLSGKGINRSYVERIQDGKTKKPEILTWFGDPQEVKRTPEGVVYIYQTYRVKQGLPPKDDRDFTKAAESPFQLEENLKRKPKKQDSGREPASSLTIRFKPDGETVQSHEYQEF